MSARVVRSDAACCPVANSAAYSASPTLATAHGIIVENTWMDPLILVGSFLLVEIGYVDSHSRVAARNNGVNKGFDRVQAC